MSEREVAAVDFDSVRGHVVITRRDGETVTLVDGHKRLSLWSFEGCTFDADSARDFAAVLALWADFADACPDGTPDVLRDRAPVVVDVPTQGALL